MKSGGPCISGEPRASGTHVALVGRAPSGSSALAASANTMGASTPTLALPVATGGCSLFEISAPQQSSTRLSWTGGPS